MNVDKRIEALQARHAEYEERLEQLEKMRWQSEAEQREIAELKKKKLLLRDEIESLRAQSK